MAETKKSHASRMAVGVDSDGEVIIDFHFGAKIFRIGLKPGDAARLRTELAKAETMLKAGTSTKQ